MQTSATFSIPSPYTQERPADHLRSVALVFLKNLVRQHWGHEAGGTEIDVEEAEDDFALRLRQLAGRGEEQAAAAARVRLVFHEDDRAVLRAGVIRAMLAAPKRERDHWSLVMIHIARHDLPRGKWPELVPGVMGAVQDTSNLGNMTTGLMLLRRLITCKMYRHRESRQVADELINSQFGVLYEMFQFLAGVDGEESMHIKYLIIKTMRSALMGSIPAYFLDPATFDGWMGICYNLLVQPIPDGGSVVPRDSDATMTVYWRAKKWIVRMVHYLFQHYGHPKLVTSLNEDTEEGRKVLKAFAVHCSTAHVPKFVNVAVAALTTGAESGQYIPPRVIKLFLDLVDTAAQQKATYKLIKPHRDALLFTVVFPLMGYDADDVELFNDDPEEFSRKFYFDFDNADSSTPREAAEAVWLTFCQSAANATHCLQFLAQKVTEYYSTDPAQRNHLSMENTFALLGAMYAILPQKQAESMENLLMNGLAPLLTTDGVPALIRARILWTLGCYNQLRMKDDAAIAQAFSNVMTCLERGNHVVVRNQAAACVGRWIHKRQVAPLVRPHIGALFDELLSMMNSVGAERVAQSIAAIVANYPQEITPHALKVADRLGQMFFQFVANEENEGGEGDGFVAVECLTALSAISESCRFSRELQEPLESVLVPLITRLLCLDGLDYMEEALTLLVGLTYFWDEIGEKTWLCLPKIFDCFESFAHDFLDHMVSPLDNFMDRGADRFYADTSNIDRLVGMAQKVLTNVGLVSDALYACQLLDTLVQNGRGRLDAHIPAIVDMCLAKMNSTKNKKLRAGIASTVMNCIIYNPAGMVQLLTERGVAEAFFGYWLSLEQNGELARFHARLVATLALFGVLSLPPTALPPVVASQMPKWFDLGIQGLKQTLLLKEQREFMKKQLGIDGQGSNGAVVFDDDDDGIFGNAGDEDEDEWEDAESSGDAVDTTEDDAKYMQYLAAQAKEYRWKDETDDVAAAEADGDAPEPEDYDDAFSDVSDDLDELHCETKLDNLDHAQVLRDLVANWDPAVREAMLAQCNDESKELLKSL